MRQLEVITPTSDRELVELCRLLLQIQAVEARINLERYRLSALERLGANVDIQKLIEDLRAYNGHIALALHHLELAAAVGVKRGPGRPRKYPLPANSAAEKEDDFSPCGGGASK